MDVLVTKDKKGRCYFVSHKLCGITEGIWLTPEEIQELKTKLDNLVL